MISRSIVLIATFCLALPAFAQDTKQTATDILQAILLPRSTAEARKEGVPEEEVKTAIQTAWEKRVPPAETKEVFDKTTESVRENGPIDNFGAFVQSQLNAGLRGRDLAAAIHAEHAHRGIGKGKKLKSDMAKAKKAKGQYGADEVEEAAGAMKRRPTDGTDETAAKVKGKVGEQAKQGGKQAEAMKKKGAAQADSVAEKAKQAKQKGQDWNTKRDTTRTG